MNSTRVHTVLLALLALALPAASYGQSADLRVLQVEHENLLSEKVTEIYNAALAKLDASYLAGVERGLTDAKAAGDLPSALSLQEEVTRLTSKGALPASDEQTAPALKKLRGIYRTELAKLETQRTTGQTALLPAYIAKLKQLEANLTKTDRIAEAKAVMDYRQGVAAGVPMKSEVAPTTGKPSAPGTPPSPAIPFVSAPAGGFTNTLGMKFAPVPSTKVLFCIHLTRVRDYVAYAAEVPNVNGEWRKQQKNGTPISVEDDYPVTGVGWNDANAFCAWLSKKEGRTYRLPTDREWSYAVGIGTTEKVTKGTTPESLDGKIKDVFPWGKQWPPPKGAGNFADMSNKEKFNSKKIIEGYNDGFPVTSPVMSFPPNKLGLYDMAGNVRQWCEDWFNAEQKERVLRGTFFDDYERGNFLSCYRNHHTPDTRRTYGGFRVVVETSAR